MKTKKYELKKPVLAVQWYKNGDHPNDKCKVASSGAYWEGEVVRYFRHPDIAGRLFCSKCGDTMYHHGWIDCGGDGIIVCPSDYIIETDVGEFKVMSQEGFRSTYKVTE